MSKKSVELTLEQSEIIINDIMGSIENYHITETCDNSIDVFKGDYKGIYIEVIKYRNGELYAIINDDKIPNTTINLAPSGANSLYRKIQHYFKSLKKKDVESIFNQLSMDIHSEETEEPNEEPLYNDNEFVDKFKELFDEIFYNGDFLKDLHDNRDIDKCSKCKSKDNCPINNYNKK